MNRDLVKKSMARACKTRAAELKLIDNAEATAAASDGAGPAPAPGLVAGEQRRVLRGVSNHIMSYQQLQQMVADKDSARKRKPAPKKARIMSSV